MGLRAEYVRRLVATQGQIAVELAGEVGVPAGERERENREEQEDLFSEDLASGSSGVTSSGHFVWPARLFDAEARDYEREQL